MKAEVKYNLLAKAFVNTYDLTREEFLNQAFETVFELITEAEKGSYYELKGDTFYPVCSKGYDKEALNKLFFHKDDAFLDYKSPNDQAIDAFEIHIGERDISTFSVEILDAMKTLGTYSNYTTLYAPIKIKNQKIGIVCLENFSGVKYSDESKTLLKIYAQMFSNLYSMRDAQEKLEDHYQEIISALVSAIELKDGYTKGHANRVYDMSTNLAILYGLNPKEIRKVQDAAILHDVGKIGVATDILIKPGRLTDEEYQEVKKHPENAKTILERIEGFDEITELAYCHHEHFDGGGYPRGLRGEETPIGAQIIQICDAFDAMTSERSYREALSKSKALSILKEEKGKQFNPELVQLMITLHE
jgi:polar amino acid transport system substrate-binding protein